MYNKGAKSRTPRLLNTADRRIYTILSTELCNFGPLKLQPGLALARLWRNRGEDGGEGELTPLGLPVPSLL